MTAKRRLDARALGVLAIGYLIGLAAYPKLPGPFLDERLTMRLMVAFLLPTTALVIFAVFRSLWAHDCVRSGNGAFESTYQAIVLRTLLFVVALHAIVMVELTNVMDAVGIRLYASRTVIVLFGVALVAVGNLLPRTRPNVAVGVRTRRTLTNAQLWQQVHRVGGYATVGLGLVIAVTGALLTHESLAGVISGAAAIAAATVFVSYHKHARA
jgi:uncharacterized membrane protein